MPFIFWQRRIEGIYDVILLNGEIRKLYRNFIINIGIDIMPAEESPRYAYIYKKEKGIILFFTIEYKKELNSICDIFKVPLICKVYKDEPLTIGHIYIPEGRDLGKRELSYIKRLQVEVAKNMDLVFRDWLEDKMDKEIFKAILEGKMERHYVGQGNTADIFLSGFFLFKRFKKFLRIIGIDYKDFIESQINLRLKNSEENEIYRETKDALLCIKEWIKGY